MSPCPSSSPSSSHCFPFPTNCPPPLPSALVDFSVPSFCHPIFCPSSLSLFLHSPPLPPSSSSPLCPQVQPVVSRSSLTTVPCGVSREEETGRSHSTKKGAFHEIFNLQESERPLAGEGHYCSADRIIVYLLPFAPTVLNIGHNKRVSAHHWLSVFSVLFVFSVWEWLEVLPHKQRQEDAHRLHQERSALRHREVSGTPCLRRTSFIVTSQTAWEKETLPSRA